MGQTFLALVAIFIFSLFALNQHRSEAGTAQSAVTGELELAATEIARSELIDATMLSFDEALVGSTAFTADANTLTPTAAFGAGGDAGETAATRPDDVDDLDGTSFVVTVERDDRTDRRVEFAVTYTIRYVVEDDPGNASPGGARTLAKEVSVTVEERVAGSVDRNPVRATLSQVVTPAWSLLHG